jgi:hypothetical protein
MPKPGAPRLTLEQLNQKVSALASQVERLQKASAPSPTWWRDHAGRFENDPVFDEIVRLGRAERKKLNGAAKGRRARPRH